VNGARTSCRAGSRRRGSVELALALALSLARYRLGVAGTVRSELARWQGQARAIADPQLRRLALAKLEQEGFNARAAAMLATFAPRRRRRETVRAIVALEVLFDYLDGRTEPRSGGDPLAWRRELFATLIWAVAEPTQAHDRAPVIDTADAAYLAALAEATRASLARLPSALATRETMARAASRASEAQTRKHARSELGEEQLRSWARAGAAGTMLDWREYLAGACASVLTLHALIASPDGEQANEIDELYLRLGAVAALLDSAVDYERDRAGEPGGVAGYLQDEDELRRSVAELVASTSELAHSSRSRRRDAVVLAGVLGYYTTGPGARTAPAASIAAELRARHGEMLAPASALMSSWRRSQRPRGARTSAKVASR
jgi:tetraprenyl-beta-curcumene synthase